jgi:hypothetical protein
MIHFKSNRFFSKMQGLFSGAVSHTAFLSEPGLQDYAPRTVRTPL